MPDYKWLDPKIRQKDAYMLKPHTAKPTITPINKRHFYRIMEIKDGGLVAVICGNMTTLTDGKLAIQDVDISRIRYSVKLGDIIAYEKGDVHFDRPTITHRFHQRHAHPAYLIAPEEK